MNFPLVTRRRHLAELRNARNIASATFLSGFAMRLEAARGEVNAQIRTPGKLTERERLRAEGARKAFHAAWKLAQDGLALERIRQEQESEE